MRIQGHATNLSKRGRNKAPQARACSAAAAMCLRYKCGATVVQMAGISVQWQLNSLCNCKRAYATVAPEWVTVLHSVSMSCFCAPQLACHERVVMHTHRCTTGVERRIIAQQAALRRLLLSVLVLLPVQVFRERALEIGTPMSTTIESEARQASLPPWNLDMRAGTKARACHQERLHGPAEASPRTCA